MYSLLLWALQLLFAKANIRYLMILHVVSLRDIDWLALLAVYA